MSGQAKRARVLAVQRHRRGNALELARAVPLYRDGGLCESLGWTSATAALLDPSRGLHFDVHAAREHARSLIALEVEQAAFEGWTRVQGLGPENREPGAFMLDEWCYANPEFVDAFRSGGWAVGTPLTLAAPEWHPPHWPRSVKRYPAVTYADHGGWPGKLARKWSGDSRAPMGRSLARLGQRLLDALKGQHSECENLFCNEGRVSANGDLFPSIFDETEDCDRCQGSGHNLRGYLPAIEWPAVVRRKVTDGPCSDDMLHLPDDWTETIGIPVIDGLTRVVPRGDHRDVPGHICTLKAVLARRRCDPDGEGEPTSLDERLWARAKAKPLREQPRWRVGELRHAMNSGPR